MDMIAKQWLNNKLDEVKSMLEARKLLAKTPKLDEMANCRPARTGLPVNIWIDETEAYKSGKHAKRIKFQINRDVRFQPSNTCTMTLDGNIPKKVWEKAKQNVEFSLSVEEIDSIKNFVVNNAYALDKVADQLLWLDDFWSIFIKGGDEATDDEIQNLNSRVDEFVQKRKDEN